MAKGVCTQKNVTILVGALAVWVVCVSAFFAYSAHNGVHQVETEQSKIYHQHQKARTARLQKLANAIDFLDEETLSKVERELANKLPKSHPWHSKSAKNHREKRRQGKQQQNTTGGGGHPHQRDGAVEPPRPRLHDPAGHTGHDLAVKGAAHHGVHHRGERAHQEGVAGLPGHHANHKRPDAESASAAVKGIRSGSERENQETAVDAAGPASIDCQTARCKRDFVKTMMQHAWIGYKKNAWGHNEVDAKHGTTHRNGLFAANGATIVDSLDTLYLMGMTDELKDAREWVAESLTFDTDTGGSVFEITIRYLGGLLSAYQFTKDEIYKQKAIELGDRLLPAFNTPKGIPNSVINLHTGHSERMGWLPCQCAVLSEMGTLNLEFEYLSIVSGDPKYKAAVQKAMNQVLGQERPRGMFPNFVEIGTGALNSDSFRLGAYGDSFYEYLIKYWRFHGGKASWDSKRQIFDETMSSVFKTLLKTSRGGLMYMADMEHGSVKERMDHLACFLGGNMILASEGAKDAAAAAKYREVAEGLTATCHQSYKQAKLGLGPDIMSFSGASEAQGGSQAWYWLRPETVESYFYMWRMTKDQKYREWAWEAIQAIEKNCKCPHGYCGLERVDDAVPSHHPTQESFFLAETLKYLYLIFSDDDVVPLSDYVFNTEAHPLPVQRS